jgi:hypothetical protein
MTEPAWLELFKAWEQSGVAQQAFCKERGVSYYQFRSVRTRLTKRGLIGSQRPEPLLGGKANCFIPLSEASQPKASMIELELPQGIILRIPFYVGS